MKKNSMPAAAVLIISMLILPGCKKAQEAGATSHSPAQQTLSSAALVQVNKPEIIPEEALKKVRLGIGHVRSRDYDSAIGEFSEAIAKFPKYVMAYNDRAAAYIRQNKFDKAKNDLIKALSINPDNPVTYYNFAAFHAIQKQSGPALEALDKALEMGFNDYDFLRSDPDLNNIRKTPEFRKVLDRHDVFVQE